MYRLAFLAVIAISLFACDKIPGLGSSKTMSGEFVRDNGVGRSTYDFRSDGTFKQTTVMAGLRDANSGFSTRPTTFDSSGAYKIEGDKVLITYSTGEGRTLTREGNGDLMEGDSRFKKQ